MHIDALHIALVVSLVLLFLCCTDRWCVTSLWKKEEPEPEQEQTSLTLATEGLTSRCAPGYVFNQTLGACVKA